ncbi:MAG: PhnD/SsuA/transferrin family substrate-binding protein, partial [Chloroflexota bacterium]
KRKMHKKFLYIIFSSLLLWLIGCTSETPTESEEVQAPPPAGESIVIADIGTNPDALIPELQPLADYLAANLDGFDSGRVVIAPDLDALSQMMADGEIDLYFDSAYPSMIVSQRTGSQLILRQWGANTAEYASVFFARADSGLTNIADLQGHTIAFDKEFSTSGYFLPNLYLLNEGYTTEQYDTLDAPYQMTR